MITVMLVDDERMAREDIRSLLDFEANGFQIVAEAENGRSGLRQFKKYRPQIVITDVEMPVMNGLEMALEIAREAAGTKFIVLTAYSEFNYARKAMTLGACSYVLKHEIDENTLLTELHKAREQIIAEQHRLREERAAALCSLIFVEQPEEYRPGDAWLLTPDRSLLLLLQLPRKEIRDREREKREPFIRAVTQALENEAEASFFYTTQSQYALVLTLPDLHSEQAQRVLLDRVVLALRTQVRQVLHTGCEIAVSRVWTEGVSCRSWYLETKNLILERLLYEGKSFHRMAPSDGSSGLRREYRALAREIGADMEKGTLEGLQEKLYGLRDDIKGTKDMQLFAQVLDTISLSLERIESPRQPDAGETHRESLRNEKSFDAIVERIIRTATAHRQKTAVQYSPRVRRAIAHIHENYNKEITLGKIAEVMDVSEIYASQYFKKETGCTPKEYYGIEL